MRSSTKRRRSKPRWTGSLADRQAFIRRYLLRQLRLMWKWYPERKAAKYAAAECYGRLTCAQCGENRPFTEANKKKFDVDHIEATGPAPWSKNDALGDWSRYLLRKFCGRANLRLLCKKCHKGKTRQDMKEMRADEHISF